MASETVTFNEFEVLKAAGIWNDYEKLVLSESEVNQLKEQKQTSELALWIRPFTPWGSKFSDQYSSSSTTFIDSLKENNWNSYKGLAIGVYVLNSIELFFQFLTTCIGGQTKVRHMTVKERFDARNCYKCFYQFTWLAIFIISVADFILLLEILSVKEILYTPET